MTLEEIENRANKFSGPDRFLMTVIFPKLLAIAKAAKIASPHMLCDDKLFIDGEHLDGCPKCLLDETLNGIEE